jgi:hypothetical protein
LTPPVLDGGFAFCGDGGFEELGGALGFLTNQSIVTGIKDYPAGDGFI